MVPLVNPPFSLLQEDDTKWVTYWVVYAFFGTFFEISDVIIFWIPFYSLLKCCLFIWLMYPGEYNGSLILYKRIVQPLMKRYRQTYTSCSLYVSIFQSYNSLVHPLKISCQTA